MYDEDGELITYEEDYDGDYAYDSWKEMKAYESEQEELFQSESKP